MYYYARPYTQHFNKGFVFLPDRLSTLLHTSMLVDHCSQLAETLNVSLWETIRAKWGAESTESYTNNWFMLLGSF